MGLLITISAALDIGEIDEPWAQAVACTDKD